MLKRRGKGSRNWARGVFAAFWILLAGVSGVYLFSAFTDPTLGGQLVQLNPLPGGASSGETTSAVRGAQSSGARDQELAEIKASLRELSQQVAELSSRLSPAEKSADASQPAPSTPPAPEPPASVAAAPPPSEPAEDVKPPEPKPAQAEAPKPAETPAPEAKPIEQAAVDVKPPAPQETTPAPKPSEPPPVVVSPLEEPPAEETAELSSDVSAPAPPPPAAEEVQTPAPSPPAPAATESAALDPVALPPAANDGSTRYGIEIGIVAKQDGLRPLWREFLTNHAALVAGLQPRRVFAPDKKWRLIAGPFSSAAEAEQACALFKKASRPCEATVYAGDGL
jgi:SPOR domain